jgi:hypothetical protein
MREFLPQGMSGSPLEKPCHSGGQGVGIAPDEQMDVIGLDSQLNDQSSILKVLLVRVVASVRGTAMGFQDAFALPLLLQNSHLLLRYSANVINSSW